MFKIFKNPELQTQFYNSITPDNLLEATQNNDKEPTIIEPTEAKAGLYITKAIYHNPEINTLVSSTLLNSVKEKFANIYIDNVVESKKDKGAKKSKSDEINFNAATLQQIENKIDKYFRIYFPFFFSNDKDKIFILQMDIKELPFEIQSEFRGNNNTVETDLVFNKNKTIDEYRNNSGSFFDDKFANLEKAYTLKLFLLKEKTATYSDIILEENKHLLDGNKTEINDKIQIYCEKNFLSMRNNNNDNDDITLSILNEKTDLTKIVSYKKYPNKDIAKLSPQDKIDSYWQSCLNPGLILPADTTKLTNYYDVSFECKTLKAFMYSDNMLGFYVINYTPSILFKALSFTPGQLQSIDLNDLYKELFINKIIELEVKKNGY